MKGREVQYPDYERIVIYPEDYDIGTRQKLYSLLGKLGVRFMYEHYS